MLRKWILLFALFLFASHVFADPTIHHKITAKIDPEKHFLEASDQITIPAAQVKPILHFILNSNLTVTSETPGVVVALDQTGVKAEDFGMDREDFSVTPDFKQNKYSLTFKEGSTKDFTFTLRLSGVINYPITQIGEEYARGFSQTPGIIDAKGVYLAGSTYWVPWFNNS